MKIAKLPFLAVLFALITSMTAQAANFLADRKLSAELSMRSYASTQRTISGDEYVLISFAKEVPLSELRLAIQSSKSVLTGVFLCSPTGGVLARHLDPAEDPWVKLADPSAIDGVGEALSKMQSHLDKIGGASPQFKGYDQYCGIEVQGTYPSISALRKIFERRTLLIEITTSRVRMVPINPVYR